MAAHAVGAQPNAFQQPCCNQGQGCSTAIKTLIAVGTVFVALGITFASVPQLSNVAANAFIGVGTPILSIGVMAGIWQMSEGDESARIKTSMVAAALILGGGIALASCMSGAPKLVGEVMISVGSSAFIMTLFTWAMKSMREEAARQHQARSSGPTRPPAFTGAGHHVDGTNRQLSPEDLRTARLEALGQT